MKKRYFGILILLSLMLLSGCESGIEEVKAKQDPDGFFEPEAGEWVEYIKPLREYMYLRTQAVLQDDIDLLWDRFPDLKENRDVEKGINVEIDDLSRNKGTKLIDANYDLESYERIQVKKLNDSERIVRVHGSVFYLDKESEESGGEFLIEFHLKQEGDTWDIVKTDEYTLPEYQEWIKKNKTNP